MPQLEPSYLRYIYDGLEKGDLHPDNAAALPEGLIGLYEAAFVDSKPARERQKLLNTLAIWALLKKEVSAQFVAEILEIPTQEIVDFIATYSSWFSSPESGKYQLYHERIKVYLLQKLSEQEIAILHNKLILRLEQAIEKQKEDDFEIYGLEFLSFHYYINAYSSATNKLFDFVLNNKIIERQIKISNGFKWSQNGLRNGIRFGVIMQSQSVVDCGLLLVRLFYQEQNDIERIIRLALDNKIELSIERIDSFGISNNQIEKKIISCLLLIDSIGTEISSKNKIISIHGYLDKFETSCFEFLFPINFLNNVIEHIKYYHLDCKKIYHLCNFNLNENSDLIRDFDNIIKYKNLNFDTLAEIENCINTNDLFSHFDKSKSIIFINKFINGESYNDLKENDLVQKLDILILISRSKLYIDKKYFNEILNEFIKTINSKIDTYYSPQDLTKIAICFYNINNIEDSKNLIIKSIEICSLSVESSEEYDCYSKIIYCLILHRCKELIYFAINNIPYIELQKYYLLLLSYINFENKNFLKSKEDIIESIKYKSLNINNPSTINDIKFNICINLIQNRKINEALALIKSIHEIFIKKSLIEIIFFNFKNILNKKEIKFLIHELPEGALDYKLFENVKISDYNLIKENYLLEEITKGCAINFRNIIRFENPLFKEEDVFAVGTIHKGTITEIVEKGGVVDFGIDVVGFIPTRHLKKEDGEKLKKGEEARFKVIEFNKELKRVVASYSAIMSVNNETSYLELEKSSIKNIASLISLNKFNLQGLEYLLVMRALNIIFMYKNYNHKEINQFNKILNIQWAIDIKNQLPN